MAGTRRFGKKATPLVNAVKTELAKATGPAPKITVGMDRNKALRKKMGLDENAGSGVQAVDRPQAIGRPTVDAPAINPAVNPTDPATDPAELERKRKAALAAGTAGKTILG